MLEDHKLPYRLLTGPDDSAFSRRVSEALARGYVLYGSPSVTFDGERVVIAQAIVLAAVALSARGDAGASEQAG